MAYRKYDTCFFERYAATALQTLLGHKFDGLVNLDRPDLQSADGHRLGIEVTRAIEGGKPAAKVLLKEMAGIRPVDTSDRIELESIIENGYAYGLQNGRYIGRMESGYWEMAQPLREIIRSKVWKVANGFYGEFSEFGLFIFCQETLNEATVLKTISYIRELQEENETRYARLFLSDLAALYVGNLDDGISYEYRLGTFPIDKEQRKQFFISALLSDDADAN